MSSPLLTKVSRILSKGPARSEIGRKQLTLAFGGLYLASTTAAAKPLLVWEEEKGYARYYIPGESLHSDIKGRLNGIPYGSVLSTILDAVSSLVDKGSCEVL
ncbi:hypothetical protein L207DRAFT_150067 [Hyaloscypha variabilis F]|uniref:Uncharacterized protein n=1 Tax=Hyaloscypha variabilis (strain UAMH 11265 / GT02V1 / F) TaxID=1149755 RepID=A0A2J6S8B0_HYAVF|nr:hypothetical protein L207DRAFT_150067 [Hyaloscypha variabilis F]